MLIERDSLPVTYDIVAEGLAFPEGPVAMPDGSILLVEIAGGALTRVAMDGGISRVARLDGGPNGAAMGPDGWMYVCNSGGWRYGHERLADGRLIQRPIGQSETPGWIERVCCADGRVERLYDCCDGVLLQSPNDVVFDTQGGFYFTDHGKRSETTLGLGVVYYGHADGRPLVRVADQLVTPNGIGLSANQHVLYVAETTPRRILAFDIDSPGRVCKAKWPAPAGGRLVVALPGFNSLDSMAIGADGHIYVASLINGGFWEIDPGVSARHFSIDDPFTTNLCFGRGEDPSIYVTLSATGRLARLSWKVQGTRLAY